MGGRADLISELPAWLVIMTSSIYELINKMWWGLAMAVVFVGLLERVPRELVSYIRARTGRYIQRHCSRHRSWSASRSL